MKLPDSRSAGEMGKVTIIVDWDAVDYTDQSRIYFERSELNACRTALRKLHNDIQQRLETLQPR